MASSCGSKVRKYNTGGETKVDPKDFVGHPIKHTTNALKKIRERMKNPKGFSEGGDISEENEEYENSKLARDSMNEMYRKREQNRQQRRGPLTRRASHRKTYAAGGPISDEERYGKVGAAIRKLDPEAYANRKDKSAEANLALLKQLREKDKSAQKSTRVESAEESMRTGKPMKDSGFTAVRAPSSGPTTRGGARRPVPAAPVARPSQGASRREFGQDLRGPKYSAGDIQTAETATKVLGAGMSAAPGVGMAMRGARLGATAAREAAKKAAEAAAKKEAAKKTAKELERRRRTLSGSNIGAQSRPTITRRTGGSITKYAAGGAVRGDGICRVKTKGRMR